MTTLRSILAIAVIVVAMALPVAASVMPDPSQRQQICINGQWEFKPGGDMNAPPADGKWLPIRVPGTWGGRYTDYQFPSYPKDMVWARQGWYRLSLTVPAAWDDGRIVRLRFDGVMGVSRVFVNGELVGSCDKFPLRKEYDITPFAKLGVSTPLNDRLNDRTIEVLVWNGMFSTQSNEGSVSWFWAERGILRDVYLVSYPAVNIECVRIIPSYRKKTLTVCTTVRNESGRRASVYVFPRVFSDAKVVLSFKSALVELKPGEQKDVVQSKTWKNPILWGPGGKWGTPHLYTAETEIYLRNPPSYLLWGYSADRRYDRFGFREFYALGTKFMLNGKPFFIKGDLYNRWHSSQDHRDRITAFLQTLRATNCNFLRLHSGTFESSLWYDTADEMGFLIQAQNICSANHAFDTSGNIVTDGKYNGVFEVLRQYIRDNFNHPSIAMWCLDNEASYPWEPDYGPKQYADALAYCPWLDRMGAYVKTNDPTRLITYAGDMLMRLAQSRSKVKNYEIFDSHCYGSPLGVSLDKRKAECAYNGKIPILQSETPSIEPPGVSGQPGYFEDPPAAYQQNLQAQASMREFSVSVAEHGAYGVIHCAICNGGYWGYVGKDNLQMGPWSDLLMQADSSGYPTKYRSIWVIPKWPSLSGEGVKCEQIPPYGRDAEGMNWFDPKRPISPFPLKAQGAKRGFYEVDGQNAPPLPKFRAPEVVVSCGIGGKPSAGEYVFITPTASQNCLPQGVMTDPQGTAWFTLPGPGKYLVTWQPLVERSRNEKIINVPPAKLTNKPGHDQITWVDLGGTPVSKLKAELTKPTEVTGGEWTNVPPKKVKATAPFAPGPFKPDADGFIRDWLVIGPFPNPLSKEGVWQGFDKDFLGGEATASKTGLGKQSEAEFLKFSRACLPQYGKSVVVDWPKTGYWDGGKATAAWVDYHSPEPKIYLLNLDLQAPGVGAMLSRMIVEYAACYIQSPEDREVTLRLGSDDGNRVWLNGQPIGSVPGERASRPDQDQYKVKLQKGWNAILIKVLQTAGYYEFYCRFTDGDKPVTDLTISLDRVGMR